jgi:hypothetical protein
MKFGFIAKHRPAFKDVFRATWIRQLKPSSLQTLGRSVTYSGPVLHQEDSLGGWTIAP